MTFAYVGVIDELDTPAQVRSEICYHCTNNDSDHNANRIPVVTEQYVKFFGDMVAYECQKCKRLIPDSDFRLETSFDDIKIGGTD